MTCEAVTYYMGEWEQCQKEAFEICKHCAAPICIGCADPCACGLNFCGEACREDHEKEAHESAEAFRRRVLEAALVDEKIDALIDRVGLIVGQA